MLGSQEEQGEGLPIGLAASYRDHVDVAIKRHVLAASSPERPGFISRREERCIDCRVFNHLANDDSIQKLSLATREY